jgi:hypothetical protein
LNRIYQQHSSVSSYKYTDNYVALEMTVCQNTIVFICTVLILNLKALVSEGFVIPPYHYYGYMGGNYFPCNWGYAHCSYAPEQYYYGNGCGCDYNVGGCAPCDNGLPSYSQWPSYPGLPYVPGLPGASGLTSVHGLPGVHGLSGVHGLQGVSALPVIPGFSSVPGSPSVPRLPSVSELPSFPGIAGVPGSPSIPELPSVTTEENGSFGAATTDQVDTENGGEDTGDINGNGEEEEEEEDDDDDDEEEEEDEEDEYAQGGDEEEEEEEEDGENNGENKDEA